MSEEDEYIAASLDFIKEYHKKGYDLAADKLVKEGLEELGQTLRQSKDSSRATVRAVTKSAAG